MPRDTLVDSLAAEEVVDYGRVKKVILQTLNLSPEAYHRQLREVTFGQDYHLRLTMQKIRAAGLLWLHPAVQMAVQVVETILVEHYIPILPFKRKNWLMCHQPATLEEAVMWRCTPQQRQVHI